MQHCQVTRRAGIKIKGRTVRQQLQKHDFPIRAVAVSRMKEGGGMDQGAGDFSWFYVVKNRSDASTTALGREAASGRPAFQAF